MLQNTSHKKNAYKDSSAYLWNIKCPIYSETAWNVKSKQLPSFAFVIIKNFLFSLSLLLAHC